MKAVLDLLDLSTADVEKRVRAIQTIGFTQNAEKLPALQARAKIETAPKAQLALREAIALIGLKDASTEVKIASLKELEKLHTIASADPPRKVGLLVISPQPRRTSWPPSVARKPRRRCPRCARPSAASAARSARKS